MSTQSTMQKEWTQRAEENAYHWVMSSEVEWNKDEYYKSGVKNIEEYVLPFFDRKHLTQEDVASFTALDIGCGTGRLCRALSTLCKNVTGIDISQEMINKAKEDNADLTNVSFVLGSGTDLKAIESSSIDFCFSFIVFQHIPSKAVIRKYFEEIYRALKPGALAKIQVRGTPGNPPGKVLWFKAFTTWCCMLVLWRKMLPIVWCKKYNTVYGACYSQNELESLLKEIGFSNVGVAYENKRYLWAEIQK